AVIALIWDARREKATRALTDKTITMRWGQHRHTLALGTAISGALMIAMGVLAIVLAVSGPGMPSGGWQTELSGWLQHISAITLHALAWLPGWAVIVILAVLFAVLIGRAMRPRWSPTLDGDTIELDDTASTPEEQQ
ncbi:MAG TPA: hypothetical protein VNW93_15070, partial [Mycobacterium sp.]|nr:hypothetical protein [Mycobacterium sp.]